MCLEQIFFIRVWNQPGEMVIFGVLVVLLSLQLIEFIGIRKWRAIGARNDRCLRIDFQGRFILSLVHASMLFASFMDRWFI